MKFSNQVMVWILAVSQLGIGVRNGWAAEVVTPEIELVQNSIAVVGSNLSAQERQAELTQAVSDYNRTAQADGQLERMEQALVALKIYEPAQAHQLTLEAQGFASSSSEKTTQTVDNEITLLASRYPSGAQFSGCSLGEIEMIGGGVGTVTMSLTWAFGETAHSDKYGNSYPDATTVKVGQTGLIVSAPILVLGIVTWALSDKSCDQGD